MKMYGNPIPPEKATGALKELYDEIAQKFCAVAVHFQLHATYALEDMKCFMDPMKMTRDHPEIPLIWFALLRLYVASKEQYPYCIALNTRMLHTLEVDDEKIAVYLEDVSNAPLEKPLVLLLEKALKSIYDSHHFNESDFEALYEAGFSDKTLYEVIVYATQFSGIAKRLNTYLVKEQG